MSYIDLHMHSYYSLDGEFSPKALVKMCCDSGVRKAALTDHNSVKGVEEMLSAGKEYGVQIIPGIEIDCIGRGTDLHLLGYGIDIYDKCYVEYEQHVLHQKKETGLKQMQVLRQLGILFEEEKVMKLAKDGIVVGEMVAETAIADARNSTNPLITPYVTGGSRSDNPFVNFFWDFCAQGKPAYQPVQYMSFEEACALIIRTGGIPVIAHPVNTVKKDIDLIAYMVQQGVRGIEVYSSYHKEEDIAYYKELAESFPVMKTMGSDFHGKSKPSVFLGKTGGDGEEEAQCE